MTSIGIAPKGLEELESDRESAEFFAKDLQNGFAYCKVVTDKKGKPVDYIYVYVNDAYLEITGSKREFVLGKRATELFPTLVNDPVDWIGKYGKVAITGEPERFEAMLQFRNVWYSVYVYSPRKGYFAVIFDDVTDRKKVEEAMQTTLDRFYSSLSVMYGAILLVSAQGTVEFANQAFCDYFLLKESPSELTGLSSDVIIEKIKNAYLHSDEEVSRIKAIVTAGKPVVGEEVALKGNRD